MINRNELIQSIDLICDSIVKIAESVIGERINDEIYYEDDSIIQYLSPYQGLAITKLITDTYKLDDQIFINLGVLHLPIRYLACYILLNSEIN